jgi:hypothetical protein
MHLFPLAGRSPSSRIRYMCDVCEVFGEGLSVTRGKPLQCPLCTDSILQDTGHGSNCCMRAPTRLILVSYSPELDSPLKTPSVPEEEEECYRPNFTLMGLKQQLGPSPAPVSTLPDIIFCMLMSAITVPLPTSTVATNAKNAQGTAIAIATMTVKVN